MTTFPANSEIVVNSEMASNNLSVPECVRGMKELDRDKFTKDVRVHCYFFEQTKATKALKVLKPYLLKILAFQPIQEGHETCCRVAYLDPAKVANGFDDLDLKARGTLLCLGLPGETSVRKLTIGYSNFRADEILRAVIPKELDSVSGYSIIGHIIHLNLRRELEEYKSVIGNVLLDKVPNIRTVVTKTDNIESTYRHFNMEVIAGKHEFETTARENRCVFSLDFSKVYWNPRLSNEHHKVVNLLGKGDVLFDVFCGIGPFVVPAAKKGVKCFANDLNPSAIDWLEANIAGNKVNQANVCVWCQDGVKFIQNVVKPAFLEFSPGNYKIIITMNLPAIAPSFFATFKGLLTPDEYSKMADVPPPKVRVYCFVKCPEAEHFKEAAKLVSSAVDMNLEEEIDRIEFVRNVAPNKDMMMVQVILSQRILVDSKRPAIDQIQQPNSKRTRGDDDSSKIPCI
ncbi:hypothetical protein GE061_003439 [Apolygus lucorum]|uniref:tRNA (guanine(37)-N1)-methyltransferase n=1 Tax=Apolygus lucorum TaxID=248454 RepID=A0A6A4JRU3_APOLU|nr:hypothetical protein GE061_003439 [Apolygus lucorum]